MSSPFIIFCASIICLFGLASIIIKQDLIGFITGIIITIIGSYYFYIGLNFNKETSK